MKKAFWFVLSLFFVLLVIFFVTCYFFITMEYKGNVIHAKNNLLYRYADYSVIVANNNDVTLKHHFYNNLKKALVDLIILNPRIEKNELNTFRKIKKIYDENTQHNNNEIISLEEINFFFMQNDI